MLNVNVDFVFITNYGTQSNLSGDICSARLDTILNLLERRGVTEKTRTRTSHHVTARYIRKEYVEFEKEMQHNSSY